MNQTTTGNESLGELIKEGLEGKGLTQAELARRVRVNRSTVTAWAKRGVVPSPGQRAILSRALELDPAVVESAALRARHGGRPARRLLSGWAVAVHPALAEALDGLSWEAQEALAKTVAALRETKPPEFRAPGGLTGGGSQADNRTSVLWDETQRAGDDDERERRRPEGTRSRE